MMKEYIFWQGKTGGSRAAGDKGIGGGIQRPGGHL